MGRKTVSLAILLTLIMLPLCISSQLTKATDDSWANMSQLPMAVAGAKASVVNDKIYVIGGVINYEYNPTTDTWVSKQAMPTPRSDGVAIAVFENKIYVIGGRTVDEGVTTGVNEVYNPATDTWETKKPMPTARQELEANAVNGKIYLIGGVIPDLKLPASSNTYIPSNKTEVYDPSTDTWMTAASLPHFLFNYASAVVDSKIFVMSGNNGDSTNSTQIYNPATDAWSFGPDIPRSVQAASAAANQNAIYVVGGFVGMVSPVDFVQVYWIENNSWSIGEPLPTARYNLATAIFNGALYAMGGSTGLFENATAQNDRYLLPSENNAPTNEQPLQNIFIIAVTAVLAIILLVAGLLYYFKHRPRTPKYITK